MSLLTYLQKLKLEIYSVLGHDIKKVYPNHILSPGVQVDFQVLGNGIDQKNNGGEKMENGGYSGRSVYSFSYSLDSEF